VIIDAFELLAERDDDVHLLLKHPGTDFRDMGLSRRRHAGRIHVVGNVPRDQLVDLYRCADVCVSVPASDSAPRTVWEAMACGTPCVLSDLPWLRGMVIADEQAVVTAITSAAVATAIGRVLDDAELAARIARNGRKLVEQEHKSDVELRRLIGVYASLAGG
jgi:glycosyltransferase involved in cell wall biosynthesis